ncbi:GrpB family protein [Chengkuizengella marina]|uniref:GrpB family protein n=1 Tax=Chengkuizengella marina TaxID=2507566 RepID=A0A6N9Q5G3_9BACL|nr:GrpB family protein [Chengkuizengella marina]NBI30088.1 GrpB family protein [Chengkuizengella marina]
MRIIKVVPYQDEWINKFQEEALKIKEIFGDQLLEIHHIGSTSVPGLKAKPIIDIIPVVKNIDEIDLFNEEMEAFGYEVRGELGIPGRRYFPKGGENRSHHVHVFQIGDENIKRHLAFRDYLIAYPGVAKEYADLKEILASKFENHPESYWEGKENFIKETEMKALNFYSKN